MKASMCVFQYQCQGVCWMLAQWSLCAWSHMWPCHWSPRQHPQHEPAERKSLLAGSPGLTCSLGTVDTEENETARRKVKWKREEERRSQHCKYSTEKPRSIIHSIENCKQECVGELFILKGQIKDHLLVELETMEDPGFLLSFYTHMILCCKIMSVGQHPFSTFA